MTVERQEKIEFLKSCETGYVADAYVRLGLVNELVSCTVDSSRCHPFRMEDKFVGPAVTVQFSPILPGVTGIGMFDVISTAEAGSAIVMSGIQDRCYMGDVLAQYAAHQQMTAMVAEGFVRDGRGCIRAGIPVFSQGGTTAAKGKTLYCITAVNKPITFHNIRINPGDIIMGDCDGIIRIPEAIFDQVYDEVVKIAVCESEYEKVFKSGGENMLEKLKKVSAMSH